MAHTINTPTVFFFLVTNNPGQQPWQLWPYYWPFYQLKIQVMFWTEHLSCFPHFTSTTHRQRLAGKFRDQTNTHGFCVRWCLSCSAKLILCLKGIIYVTSKYAIPLKELKYVAGTSCKQKSRRQQTFTSPCIHVQLSAILKGVVIINVLL